MPTLRLVVERIEADSQYVGLRSVLVTALDPFHQQLQFLDSDPAAWQVGDYIDVTVEKVVPNENPGYR